MIDEWTRSFVFAIVCAVGVMFERDMDRTSLIIERYKYKSLTHSGRSRMVLVAHNFFANYFGVWAAALCAARLVAAAWARP